ncbi:MAG: sigma-70 family RNA polymerase sigma factor [Planctomycetaceae bacterium]
MNDSAFLEGLRTQDPAAVQHLSDCFLPTVWRFVYIRVNQDRHLAEDVVSEAVLALIRAAADPNVLIKCPAAWLRSVAGNKIADHFRTVARVQHLIDDARRSGTVSDDEDAAAVHEADERRQQVRQVMDGLSEQYRLALEWKYIDHVSVRDIADRLDCTEKAAESILFRARREFRHRMEMRDLQEDVANLPAGRSASDAVSQEIKPDDSAGDGSSVGSQNFGSSIRMSGFTHRPST